MEKITSDPHTVTGNGQIHSPCPHSVQETARSFLFILTQYSFVSVVNLHFS